MEKGNNGSVVVPEVNGTATSKPQPPRPTPSKPQEDKTVKIRNSSGEKKKDRKCC